jgi:uncharacterized integral membrane protein (TIGR00698 family)
MQLPERNLYTFHGILLVFAIAVFALWLSTTSFLQSLKISPLLCGVLLGMLYGNTLRGVMPERWQTGIWFCSKQVLRLGIILYGLRLSLPQLMSVGWLGFSIATVMLVSTILLSYYCGVRWLKLTPSLALLTGVGAGVCGAAAVAAADPVVRGRPQEASMALATVVLFGTIAMFLYPIMLHTHLLPLDPSFYGLYVGGTVHEVAQVVAAASAGGQEASQVAVIVKMTRVLLLIPLLLALGWYYRQIHVSENEGHTYRPAMPWFIVGFAACIVLNSYVAIPAQIHSAMLQLNTLLLTMAMAALGMETRIATLKNLGLRPFYLALILFFWLTLGGFWIVKGLINVLQ